MQVLTVLGQQIGSLECFYSRLYFYILQLIPILLVLDLAVLYLNCFLKSCDTFLLFKSKDMLFVCKTLACFSLSALVNNADYISLKNNLGYE